MELVGLLQSVSGAAAAVLLLRYGFGYAWRRKRTAFWICLCAAAVIQIGLFFIARRSPEAAGFGQEAFVFAESVLFPYTLLRHGRKRTFFLFGLAYCATCDYAVFLLPARWSDVAYVILDCFMILLALRLGKVRKESAPPDYLEQIPVWIFIAVFAADLSMYYDEMAHRDATYYGDVSLAFRIGSFVLIVVSIIFAAKRYLLARRAEREAQEQLTVQLRHYEELVEKNRSVRAFRHDYENNLLSLSAILDAGQTEDARAYVQTLQNDAHNAAYAFATGNYLADAILSDKAAQAHDIQICFDGTVPATGVTNPDLCTILCNLLDNAIRGCQNCAPCAVELTGRETTDRWFLTVSNPVTKKVSVRGDTIRTTKADRDNHGIGLKNIRRTAEKYNGYVELQCDDRRFTVEVGLMLNTEERE